MQVNTQNLSFLFWVLLQVTLTAPPAHHVLPENILKKKKKKITSDKSVHNCTRNIFQFAWNTAWATVHYQAEYFNIFFHVNSMLKTW